MIKSMCCAALGVTAAFLVGTWSGTAIAADGTTIHFASDDSWNVFTSDPGDPPATLIGQAQPVCLNSSAPNPCPSGAVVYGASNAAGWLANLATIPGAEWVWAPGVTGASSPAELAEFYFAKTFTCGGTPAGGSVSIAADDLAEVLVNGVSAGVVGSITDSVEAAQARNTLTTIDIGALLVEGENTIVVRGRNGPPSFAGCEPGPCTYAQNPAGVVFGGAIAFGTPNQPPDCTGAYAQPDYVWPPNHKLVPVAVLGVSDPDGDAVRVTVTGIAQDEPVGSKGTPQDETFRSSGTPQDDDDDDDGDGDHDDGDDDGSCPGASGVGTSTAAVRAERDGGGNGRVYHIAFIAEDGLGGRCAGEVEVCVPHDRGNGRQCGDGGPLYDATGPCGGCQAPSSCEACPYPWSCADDDPCTIDVCTPTGCQHEPAVGLWGCRCYVDPEWHPPVCGGYEMPQSLTTRLELARRLVDGASDARRGRKSVKKAVQQLRKANALVAARGSDLPQDCAQAIESRIRTARQAAMTWLRSTSGPRDDSTSPGGPRDDTDNGHGKGGDHKDKPPHGKGKDKSSKHG